MLQAALRPKIRRRRGAAVLAASAVAHVAILGAFALHQPRSAPPAELPTIAVSLVPAPVFAPRQAAAAPPRPHAAQARVVPLDDVAPRYAAAAEAPTGEAADAVDLFGPVFADGLWPRPVRVRSEPCRRDDPTPRAATCERDLMLVALPPGRAPPY